MGESMSRRNSTSSRVDNEQKTIKLRAVEVVNKAETILEEAIEEQILATCKVFNVTYTCAMEVETR